MPTNHAGDRNYPVPAKPNVIMNDGSIQLERGFNLDLGSALRVLATTPLKRWPKARAAYSDAIRVKRPD